MSRHKRRRSESSDSDESRGRHHHRRKRKLSAEEEDRMIAEYLAKKAEKKALKLAKKQKTETFVWKKKIERDVCQGRALDDSYFALKDEEERMAEIKKVQQRKEERDRQRAQREEEMELLARERARAEFQDWEKKEEEFNYEQSRIKSEKRLREGRFKPIDHLVLMSKHLNGGDKSDNEFDELGMDLEEPYMHVKGLAVEALEELRDDIQMHVDNSNSAMPEHAEFWEALLVVCESELVEVRRKDAVDRARARGEEPPVERKGLHSSVEADVMTVLDQCSTLSELKRLQRQTEKKVSGEDRVAEFWEAILSQLPVRIAKAYLKEQYAKILLKYPQNLEQKVVDGEDNSDIVHGSRADPMEEEEREDETGSFSPQAYHGDENEQVVDAEEDRAMLERKRMAVLEANQRRIQAATPKAKPPPQEADLEMRQVAMRAMGEMREGDKVFDSRSEVNINTELLAFNSLDDKYRPRKPKYYNRFHTGFEWNKYNQTHYDHDNPPPKVVMGYKFNIFYPELIDRTRTPTYYIEDDVSPDNTNNGTCIIRFSAGPPYEDIAFRIVRKDWEYSHKKGFKCTFERGILQLYFNFKRYRYRR